MADKKGYEEAIADMCVAAVGKSLLDTYRWIVELRLTGGITGDTARKYIDDLTSLNEELRKNLIKDHGLNI